MNDFLDLMNQVDFSYEISSSTFSVDYEIFDSVVWWVYGAIQSNWEIKSRVYFILMQNLNILKEYKDYCELR